MKQTRSRVPAALALTLWSLAGCAQAISGSGSQASSTASAPTRVRSEADVNFMAGMIPHHAQAVLIAGWARSHGARNDVAILCDRIVVGQRDEIALMQRWLRDRGEEVPAADAMRHKMKMNGMVHEMLMPGMLNDEQLAALDKARGADFDRLFLEAMIAHHAGAVSMVNELLGAKNAGNDDIVYRFASDVFADQTTEIERMQKMLATVPASSRP
jgi:uncharacterized protein (DUF305 family)